MFRRPPSARPGIGADNGAKIQFLSESRNIISDLVWNLKIHGYTLTLHLHKPHHPCSTIIKGHTQEILPRLQSGDVHAG